MRRVQVIFNSHSTDSHGFLARIVYKQRRSDLHLKVLVGYSSLCKRTLMLVDTFVKGQTASMPSIRDVI